MEVICYLKRHTYKQTYFIIQAFPDRASACAIALCSDLFSPLEKLFSTKPSQTVNETLVHYDYNTCFNLKSQKL